MSNVERPCGSDGVMVWVAYANKLEQQLKECQYDKQKGMDGSLAHIAKLEGEVAELREVMAAGVNRFYMYEGEAVYDNMKALLEADE